MVKNTPSLPLRQPRVGISEVSTFKHLISIGNSMVSSAILEQTCTSEFFKDYQNCTSSMDECSLKSLKNARVYVFSNCTRNHTITY